MDKATIAPDVRVRAVRPVARRADAGAAPSEGPLPQPVDVPSMIAGVVDAARCSYPGRILLDSEPAQASIAPGTLHRLLWLLLEQAMRSAGEAGTLRVAVAATGGGARLLVEHERPGALPGDDDDRERVHEMVMALVRPVGGWVRDTSLGPCRRLVEVRFPVGAPADQPETVRSSPRVLLFQPRSRLTADALRVVMLHRGYTTVDVCATAEDAAALALSGRYDVCVADLGADLDDEVAGRLRRLMSSVRVVVLRDGTSRVEIAGADVVDVTGAVDDILAVIERRSEGPCTTGSDRHPCVRGRPVDEQSLRARYALTAREEEVLIRLGSGQRTGEIAGGMGIKVSTARTHIQSVLTKLRVHSKLEAVTRVAREGGFDAES